VSAAPVVELAAQEREEARLAAHLRELSERVNANAMAQRANGARLAELDPEVATAHARGDARAAAALTAERRERRDATDDLQAAARLLAREKDEAEVAWAEAALPLSKMRLLALHERSEATGTAFISAYANAKREAGYYNRLLRLSGRGRAAVGGRVLTAEADAPPSPSGLVARMMSALEPHQVDAQTIERLAAQPVRLDPIPGLAPTKQGD
jgi:hypothetical protein